MYTVSGYKSHAFPQPKWGRRSAIAVNPIRDKMKVMTTNRIIAKIAVKSAFNQPQWKKCLINPNQTITMTISAINPVRKLPTTIPTRVPKAAIQSPSTNLARFPSRVRPESHRTGPIMMVLTMSSIRIAPISNKVTDIRVMRVPLPKNASKGF